VRITPAHNVADLELGDTVPDLLDGANALVPEDHVGVLEVLVGATYSRVSYFDEDFVSCRRGTARRALDDALVCRTFEYSEFDAHFCCWGGTSRKLRLEEIG
jgi:hypothetical protein